MKPSNTIVISPKYIKEKERQIADLSKKVERLQEQLKEANGVITSYIRNNPLEKYGPAEAYAQRWGVK